MWTTTPTTAPTALRTVPRARRTTPLRDATSGAISSATGETRPARIVTGGRAWAGRADTHACSSLHRARWDSCRFHPAPTWWAGAHDLQCGGRRGGGRGNVGSSVTADLLSSVP